MKYLINDHQNRAMTSIIELGPYLDLQAWLDQGTSPSLQKALHAQHNKVINKLGIE